MDGVNDVSVVVVPDVVVEVLVDAVVAGAIVEVAAVDGCVVVVPTFVEMLIFLRYWYVKIIHIYYCNKLFF